MANVIGNTARGFLSLQRTLAQRLLFGTCLQNRLSTSAMLGQTSKSPSENSKKIYDMRTYYIRPKDFAEFMQLTNEYIHLKSDTNSVLNGYWTSDIGGLNEVTHIWEYGNYAQRAEAIKALYQDQTWVNNYVKKILKMLVKQDNLVMNPVHWFNVKPPLTTGGVYELRMYDLVLGKTEQWVHRLVQGLPDRCKLSEPVGVWFTEFGPINRAIMLWPFQRLDDRIRIRKEAQEFDEWVEAIRDCLPLERKAYSKVLIPTEFSPWK
ncbi:protein NipSnap homolog 3B-like [Oculina patagonica]